MQRKIIFVLVILILLLAAALAYVLLRGQPASAPISIDAANEDASDPYRREMDCIDRLLQQHDLDKNQVEPAFARCRGGGSGNQSQGQ